MALNGDFLRCGFGKHGGSGGEGDQGQKALHPSNLARRRFQPDEGRMHARMKRDGIEAGIIQREVLRR
jgi:hypothetical protein